MRRGETEARESRGQRVAFKGGRRWCDRLRPRRRVLAMSAVLLTATTMCGRPRAASANAPLEYEVKAAFLFRFAQFVEWPADTFKDANDPFTYCTIGDDPFHGTLERTLNGKTIGQHPLRVEH